MPATWRCPGSAAEATISLPTCCCGKAIESTWPTNGPGDVGGEYEVMPPFGLPLINTALLLTSSHHGDDRASCAARRQAHAAGCLPGSDVHARLRVRLPAGRRVRSRLPGPEPEADVRHLRLDVLHADRLPRHARDHRRHHADDHLLPRAQRPLHARTSTSPSRPSPGTGTSSTLSGSACTSSSTGCRRLRTQGVRARW